MILLVFGYLFRPKQSVSTAKAVKILQAMHHEIAPSDAAMMIFVIVDARKRRRRDRKSVE